MSHVRTCPVKPHWTCTSDLCLKECKERKGDPRGLVNSNPPNHRGQPVSEPVSTKNCLNEAGRIIYGDREKTYGAPDKNLKTIGRFWSEYIFAKHSKEVSDQFELDVDDVCYMMVLLKLARLANDPEHRDSMTDACGYIALAERVQNMKPKGPV